MARSLSSLALALVVVLAACGGTREGPPSVLLVVVDTLRADAVSRYGTVDGTTPVIDRLASEGVLYRNAFSSSSWTLPSHASLLTGRSVETHRLGMPGRTRLPEDLLTLAERFSAAGYDTAAFAENLLVSDAFGLLRGFDHSVVTRVIPKSESLAMPVYVEIEADRELRAWMDARDSDRPAFVFVNIVDPHGPYSVREENPWVPADAGREEMERHAEEPEKLLCGALPSARDVEILRGLYLGDVAAADRKLGRVIDALRAHLRGGPLLTVVTSDHGELFGEHDLLGHEYNVRRGALHVPLVVHGLPEVEPAEIEAPVTLADVAASLLAWTGVEDPGAVDGRLLPVAGDAPAEPRTLVASYSDTFTSAPPEWRGMVHVGATKEIARSRCGPDDKVFGGMASVIEYPFKLDWYQHYDAELYDLRWDPGEQSELSAHHAELAARLASEAERFARASGLAADGPGDPREAQALDAEQLEALRALGYVD